MSSSVGIAIDTLSCKLLTLESFPQGNSSVEAPPCNYQPATQPSLPDGSLLFSCRPKLASFYVHKPEVPQDVWPPVKTIRYINLALIRQQQMNAYNEYARETIRGSIDDIMREKTEVLYENVFENLEDGARILFEGRPGCGKTTTMHKISQDWEKKEILPLTVLFLVHVRVFGNKKDVTLVNILQATTRDFTQQEINTMARCIEETSGKGVVFALDGLDEYRPKEKKNNFIFELIRGERLTNAVVIVASRPAASQKFRKHMTKHIEIIGFLKQQIDEYINCYYAGKLDLAQCLMTYLEQHPNVLHMCYLPIHIVMVTFLHEMMGTNLPETETEIYYHFTLYTLVRSISKRNDADDDNLIVLKSFDQLTGDNKITFELILHLAFTATVTSKQVFSRSDEVIEKLISSHHTGDDSKLGLIVVDRDYVKYGLDEIYSFLHLTFQEYLAACYVARLDASDQKDIIKKHATKKHLAVMWKFYCGMTKSKFAHEDYMKNFKLLLNETSDCLLLIHFANESQQKCICTSVIQSQNAAVKLLNKPTLNAADCTALSFVLLNSEVDTKIVELTACHLGPESFSAIVKRSSDRLLPIEVLKWVTVHH